MSARPLVWAEIRLDHLVHNLKKVRRRVGPDAEVLAVVKADAYGHGMVPVARALAANGVRFFGVVGIDEAVELRRSCPAARILVLGPFHPARLPAFFKHRIVPTVSSLEDVRAIEAGARHAAPLRARIPVHVKIDTGMGRLGVWHEETLALFRALGRSKSLVVEGLYTHLAQADAEGHDFTRTQLERFERALGEARALGLRPEFVHAANSVGGHRFPYARYNLVRAGILLYGLDPSRGRVRGLKPVMSLKARVSFLKDAGPGRPLSYGGTYRTKRRTRIAVLPVGYSHGYRVDVTSFDFVELPG